MISTKSALVPRNSPPSVSYEDMRLASDSSRYCIRHIETWAICELKYFLHLHPTLGYIRVIGHHAAHTPANVLAVRADIRLNLAADTREHPAPVHGRLAKQPVQHIVASLGPTGSRRLRKVGHVFAPEERQHEQNHQFFRCFHRRIVPGFQCRHSACQFYGFQGGYHGLYRVIFTFFEKSLNL